MCHAVVTQPHTESGTYTVPIFDLFGSLEDEDKEEERKKEQVVSMAMQVKCKHAIRLSAGLDINNHRNAHTEGKSGS